MARLRCRAITAMSIEASTSKLRALQVSQWRWFCGEQFCSLIGLRASAKRFCRVACSLIFPWLSRFESASLLANQRFLACNCHSCSNWSRASCHLDVEQSRGRHHQPPRQASTFQSLRLHPHMAAQRNGDGCTRDRCSEVFLAPSFHRTIPHQLMACNAQCGLCEQLGSLVVLILARLVDCDCLL